MANIEPYWEHDRIEIYCGDNRKVLPHLSGVDLIVTSPPYNMGNTTGVGFAGKGGGRRDVLLGSRGWGSKWSGGALAGGYDTHDDKMPHADYVAWQHEVLRLCWGALSSTGAIYYNHKVRILSGRAVLPLEYNPGLPLRQIIIWARAGGINFSKVF